MTSSREIVERRKHERLQIQHGAFVILKSYDNKVGQIADISPDGLTFIYHTSGKGSVMATQLDIFVAGSPVHMNKIPCRTISEFEIDSDIHRSIIKRRCGLQFEELTPDQKFELESFIQNHTLGEVV
jgi:hypothetical protein